MEQHQPDKELKRLRGMLSAYTEKYKELIKAGASPTELNEARLAVNNIRLAIDFEKPDDPKANESGEVKNVS